VMTLTSDLRAFVGSGRKARLLPPAPPGVGLRTGCDLPPLFSCRLLKASISGWKPIGTSIEGVAGRYALCNTRLKFFGGAQIHGKQSETELQPRKVSVGFYSKTVQMDNVDISNLSVLEVPIGLTAASISAVASGAIVYFVLSLRIVPARMRATRMR
jgi:hypothetical protein